MTEPDALGQRTTQVLAVLELTATDLAELITQHPWLAVLPDQELALLLLERERLHRDTCTPAQDTAFWTSWQHTADIYADPELHAALTRPLRFDGPPVPRPPDDGEEL